MGVISIDPSKTSTGIFYHGDIIQFFKTIENNRSASIEKACENIYAKIRAIMYGRSPDYAIIEGYMSKGSRVVQQAEVTGVIKLALAHCNIPVITMPIATWKSIYGRSICKKKNPAEYIKTVEMETGYLPGNVDEADACIMWWCCQKIVSTQMRLTKAAMEIKKQIEKILEEEE